MVGSAAMAMWDVTTGTLVIDLFDRKTDRVVFRGTINEVLQRAPSADLQADAKLVSKPVKKASQKSLRSIPSKANRARNRDAIPTLKKAQSRARSTFFCPGDRFHRLDHLT